MELEYSWKFQGNKKVLEGVNTGGELEGCVCAKFEGEGVDWRE